eukprot:Selendium_serpulae@DN6450_c2_g2_i2.p1
MLNASEVLSRRTQQADAWVGARGWGDAAPRQAALFGVVSKQHKHGQDAARHGTDDLVDPHSSYPGLFVNGQSRVKLLCDRDYSTRYAIGTHTELVTDVRVTPNEDLLVALGFDGKLWVLKHR